MGLFGLFGSRTKADIDREIASLQGEVERLKAAHAVAKERQKWKNGVNYKIAALKAERKNAK